MVTRPTPIPDLDQTIRAGMAYAHNPDLTLTIGFNSTTGGNPWGNIGNGGSEVYSRGGGLDEQARATMLGILPVYTTRPATAESRTSPLLPYDDYQGLPGALLHLETLYLNHNFDRVVIDQGFSYIVDGVFTSLGVQLTNQGFNCVDPNPGGGWPDPPSSAQVAAWMQLGLKNYAAYGGDPVNFATGNLVELEDLFHVTGPGGSDTQVALVYNSMDGRATRFGTGWSSDLTARAQRFTDGSVMVVRGDGASWVFAPNGSGGYTADANTGATLAEAGGGHLLLTVDDGTTWRFDASHPEGVGDVVERTDPTGAVTKFEYAALTGDPLFRSLTAVVLPGGQRVTVTSDARGMVTALTAPDGRTWQLGYDDALDLRTITLPDGRVRSFDYDSAHQLVTARDGAGAVYLTNVYDSAGRVVSQGRHREQRTVLLGGRGPGRRHRRGDRWDHRRSRSRDHSRAEQRQPAHRCPQACLRRPQQQPWVGRHPAERQCVRQRSLYGYWPCSLRRHICDATGRKKFSDILGDDQVLARKRLDPCSQEPKFAAAVV